MDANFFLPIVLVTVLLVGLLLLARSARVVNQYEKGIVMRMEVSQPGFFGADDHHASDGQHDPGGHARAGNQRAATETDYQGQRDGGSGRGRLLQSSGSGEVAV